MTITYDTICDMCYADPVDIFNLPRGSGHLAAAVHDQQDGRGGDHHKPLSVRPGLVQSTLHLQLDLPLLLRGLLRLHCCCRWLCADRPLLRLLLPLHFKRYNEKEPVAFIIRGILI